ncbi:MAG: ATP-binding protein [Ruminococcus sp.]|nr:ATP-binding protein [Ruminococcus sp.]
MEWYFNITGSCNPQEHYMVNLDSRLAEIKKMIDKGQYFCINRERQYGKTTTLKVLKEYLSEDYIVINMDFQIKMSNAKFQDDKSFSTAFTNAFSFSIRRYSNSSESEEALKNLKQSLSGTFELVELFMNLSEICRHFSKPVVLVIDEIDSASNNQVFLDFLAQLRGFYLNLSDTPTFQSVILAGVHDIRNMHQKIRSNADHNHNSPWNIA